MLVSRCNSIRRTKTLNSTENASRNQKNLFEQLRNHGNDFHLMKIKDRENE